MADELAFFCRMKEVLVKVSNLYLMGVQVRKGELEDLCAHASKFGRILKQVQIIEENAIASITLSVRKSINSIPRDIVQLCYLNTYIVAEALLPAC